MLSICVKTDDSAGCTECFCSSGYRRKLCFLKNSNYLKNKPLKQEAAANPSACKHCPKSLLEFGLSELCLPLTMVWVWAAASGGSSEVGLRLGLPSPLHLSGEPYVTHLKCFKAKPSHDGMNQAHIWSRRALFCEGEILVESVESVMICRICNAGKQWNIIKPMQGNALFWETKFACSDQVWVLLWGVATNSSALSLLNTKSVCPVSTPPQRHCFPHWLTS